MFSGKTNELIKQIKTSQIMFGDQIMIINHKNDDRYDVNGNVCSHDKNSFNAISLTTLTPILFTQKFHEAKAIFIDEAQFFEDLYDFVNEALEQKKRVVVCGLDGDYERKPIGQILQLIPLADSVNKLSALCKRCNYGTLAIFSKRITRSTEKVVIGNENTYEPVCRYHFEM
jgi:thymidine kinase